MTAAMLVLEPIFEADLPPEQYAYRPGRNAQSAGPTCNPRRGIAPLVASYRLLMLSRNGFRGL
jgi:hypothetical protein